MSQEEAAKRQRTNMSNPEADGLSPRSKALFAAMQNMLVSQLNVSNASIGGVAGKLDKVAEHVAVLDGKHNALAEEVKGQGVGSRKWTLAL